MTLKTAMEVGQELVRAKQEPADNDLLRAMLLFYPLENAKQPIPQELVDTTAFQIVRKRCAFHNVEATDHVVAMVALLCDRPGTAVLYAAALFYMHRKAQRPVNLDVFTTYFAHGFPGEADLHRIWLEQKGAQAWGGNYLDSAEAWI